MLGVPFKRSVSYIPFLYSKVVHGVVVVKSDGRSPRTKKRLLPDHMTGTVMTVRRAPGALTKIRKSYAGPRTTRMMMAGPRSAANAKASEFFA